MLRIQASLDQIGKQGLEHGDILGAALAKPQHMLVALGIDAQGNKQYPVAEMKAIHKHHREIHSCERARQPPGKALCRQRHKAARDRAARDGALPLALWQPIERGSIAAARDPGGNGQKRGLVQGIGCGCPAKASRAPALCLRPSGRAAAESQCAAHRG